MSSRPACRSSTLHQWWKGECLCCVASSCSAVNQNPLWFSAFKGMCLRACHVPSGRRMSAQVQVQVLLREQAPMSVRVTFWFAAAAACFAVRLSWHSRRRTLATSPHPQSNGRQLASKEPPCRL
jgi:hypothetical protein